MDERGRARDRAALATNEGAHKAAALAERVRRGRLTYERVALGAMLGDPVARALAGEPQGEPCVLCRRPTLWGLCLGGDGDWPRKPLDGLLRAHQVSPALVEATVRAAVAAGVLSWRRGWAACRCIQCVGARESGLTPEEVEGLNRSKREGGPVHPGRTLPFLWMCDSAVCAENVSAAAAFMVNARPEMDPGRAARWDATLRAIGQHLIEVQEALVTPVYEQGVYREMEAMRGITLGRRYADGAFDATGIDHDRLLRDRRHDGEERDAMMPMEFTGDGSEVVQVSVPFRRNATQLLRTHAPMVPEVAPFVPRGPAWAFHLLAAVEALLRMRETPARGPHQAHDAPRDAMRHALDALVLVEFERRATEPRRFGPAAVFSDYPERATDGLRPALSWDEEARDVMAAVASWALAA